MSATLPPQAAQPSDTQGTYSLALDHQRQGRLDQAEAIYRRIIAAAPEHADALHQLGLTCLQKGQFAEALHVIDRSLALRPERAEYHSNRGVVLRRLGRAAEAVEACRRAVALKPDLAGAQHSLGNALTALGRHAEAVAAYRCVIALEPENGSAHGDLGAGLLRLGQDDEALGLFRRAVEIEPGNAQASSNLGAALNLLGRFAEAESAYRGALARQPSLAGAHYNLGIALLAQGRLVEGWREWEWRHRVRALAAPRRPFAQPPWSGVPLASGKLIVWGEHGVGDTILYSGVIPEVLGRAPHCVLECDPRLQPLFARSFPRVEVVAAVDPPHPRTAATDIVQQSSLGSLPRWFRTRFEDFPARPAYLTADPERVAALRARYRALGAGAFVGVSWRGRNPVLGQAKTTALADWAPIFAIPGITFVDLQFGDTVAERAALLARTGVTLHRDASVDPLADLDGFAAQVAAMDLVISVSNTTVHMAGALGKQAWVMLPRGRGSMWYWFLEREDSPWYPSLRLFRQSAPGAWRPLIERVAAELIRWTSGRAIALRPDDAKAYSNLGEALRRQGDLDGAVAAFRRAIALQSDLAGAHSNLGVVLRQQGLLQEALASSERAVELAPGLAEAHNNLGAVLIDLGRFDAAEAAIERALAIRPHHHEAHNNLGIVLRRRGRLTEAVMACRRAIELAPDYAEAHNTLGVALHDLEAFAEAAAAHERALAARPSYADAHANLGLTLLSQGKFSRGWDEYAWRASLEAPPARRRLDARPSWSGTPLAQGQLWLWGEQGVGDTILFAGMMAEALGLAPRCVLECDARLQPLFARSFPALEVVAFRDPPAPRLLDSDIVVQAPIGALPRWFRNRMEDFPVRPAYLTADPEKVVALRARYRALGAGALVGIAWRSRNPVHGQAKTTALAAWAPILAVHGVTFIDLQYGDTSAERSATQASLGVSVHRDASIDPLVDLDGFAAQVAAMDLVISVSNTTVHMAGALGKQAWVMLPRGPGSLWYWFLGRERSPWYPSLRLLRQAEPGDWRPAIERVARELASWVGGGGRSGEGMIAS